MKILFLTLAYEKNSNSIYSDLVCEFVQRGHEIKVVTPLERRNNKNTYIEYEKNGVEVLRFKSLNIQKTNLLEKGIGTILLESLFVKAIKKYYGNESFDLVIYSTPPIMFSKVISYIKRRYKAKSYLLLKDIFPQNAVDLNMMSKTGVKGFIYKYFRRKEENLYDLSDFIGCMSEANVEYIKVHNKLDNKIIEVCPNSIIPTNIQNFDKKGIRKKYNISEDKLILIYGGNLGKPQGIEFFKHILKRNKNNRNIEFLIIGNGTEYNNLENFIKIEKFENVKLFSRLPKLEYDEYVRASDLGLIFLDERFTIPNFPSRLLGYMDVGIPIIASTDRNTDIGSVITKNKFGYWCESGNLKAFNHILKECVEQRKQLIKKGENARLYLEENYTVKKTTDIILKHFD